MKSIFVFLLFIFLTCYTIDADELLTSSLDQDQEPNFTPCDSDEDCDGFQNGMCVNTFCECNGTRFCEDKTDTIVTKLGEFCKATADCNIEHSVCKENKCECEDGRVGASDGRRCLKAADALGSTCEDSIQCYTKIPHSGCQNEKCVCQQQMHEYEGACYRNAGLGEKCQLIGECSATQFSKCIDEKCVCREGYVQNQHANRCLEIPTKMSGPCHEDIQCSTKFGKAICKMGHCHCEELYQYKFTKGTCVRDMLLGERCENHTDCHGPEEGKSRSECVLGECKCRSEFIEEHGYCTNSDQPCIDLSSCYELESEKNLSTCILGRCECEEERPYCTNNAQQQPKTNRQGSKRTEHMGYMYKKEEINLYNIPEEEKESFEVSGIVFLLLITLIYTFFKITPELQRAIPIVSCIYVYLGIFCLILIFHKHIPNVIYGMNFMVLFFILFLGACVTVCMSLIALNRWLQLSVTTCLSLYFAGALLLMIFHPLLPEIINEINLAIIFCVSFGCMVMFVRNELL